MKALKQLESQLWELKGHENIIHEQLNMAKMRLNINKKKLKDIEESIEISQIVAELTQEEVIVSINDLVTSALHAVFPEDPYDFKLEITRKNNRTQAEPNFIRDGHNVKPADNAGVGSANVGAVSLRVGLLSMDESNPRRLLILDEPFRDLSRDKHGLAALLIDKISRDLGIQILIASHSTSLAETSDKIFNIMKSRGRVYVNRKPLNKPKLKLRRK